MHAQGILDVYVDTAYTGSESGTQAQPYNTLQEGRAFAQVQSGGAWRRTDYVPPVRNGRYGIPLTNAAIYALLAVLALALILAGWKLQRRSAPLRAR